MTVGAAQLLAKRHGIIPGHRVLLAGSGPLLLPAAVSLAEHGAEVVGILEATHPAAWLGHGPAVWGNWDRLTEGRHYVGALRKANIPYHFGRTVIRALGKDRLDAAVVAQLDSHGCPISGTEERLPVDALCVSFGLVPNVELAQLAGAALCFEPDRGGWTPELDKDGQTTVPGLFVAGEAASIAGAGAAMLEGRLAALGAAWHLGRVTQTELAREQAVAASRRSFNHRFGAMLNTLFGPPPGLSAITTDGTPICRCEEVTAGDVRGRDPTGRGDVGCAQDTDACRPGPVPGPHVRPDPGSDDRTGNGQAGCRRRAVPCTSAGEAGAGGGSGRGDASVTVQADVVVIGGGIVGAACAYYLAGRGHACGWSSGTLPPAVRREPAMG